MLQHLRRPGIGDRGPPSAARTPPTGLEAPTARPALRIAQSPDQEPDRPGRILSRTAPCRGSKKSVSGCPSGAGLPTQGTRPTPGSSGLLSMSSDRLKGSPRPSATVPGPPWIVASVNELVTLDEDLERAMTRQQTEPQTCGARAAIQPRHVARKASSKAEFADAAAAWRGHRRAPEPTRRHPESLPNSVGSGDSDRQGRCSSDRASASR